MVRKALVTGITGQDGSYLAEMLLSKGYDLFACNGILFNHESPHRGGTFVSHKITRAVARILAGQQQKLYLGNLDTRRDWGYAPEYVEAMWLMLQQDAPDDYVLGTGESHSVREFVEEGFQYAGLDWEEYVVIDPRYFRPLDVDCLVADISKSRARLDWSPKVSFRDLVRIMVDADLEALSLKPIGEGGRILKQKCPLWHQWSGSVTATLQNPAQAFE